MKLRTTNSHTVKVILLPPPASDFGSEDLDIEVIPENPEEGFEPTDQHLYHAAMHPGGRTRLCSIFLLRRKDIVRCECLQQLAELSAYNVWRCVFTDQMVEYLVDQTTTFHGRRDVSRVAFYPT
ncbi:Acetolactate synthase isozyme 1 small subunit [Trichinella pseudospiralis]